MAKFILNSTATKSVRKDDVDLLEINQMITGSTEQGDPVYGDYELVVWVGSRNGVSFETGGTLEAVQALAASVITALES